MLFAAAGSTIEAEGLTGTHLRIVLRAPLDEPVGNVRQEARVHHPVVVPDAQLAERLDAKLTGVGHCRDPIEVAGLAELRSYTLGMAKDESRGLLPGD